MNNKQAYILLAKPPVLGQVGHSLPGKISEEQRLEIYSSYLSETISYFNTLPNIDLIISCEERYQEVLLQNHFPQLKLSKVISGDLGDRLEELAHYALSYLEYKQVFITSQEFIFVSEENLHRWGRVLDRTSHSIILVPYENNLGIVGLNFPFTGLYEDVVWQKANVIKQLQGNIKNLHIKSTIIEEDVFSAELSQNYPETTQLMKAIS